MRNIRTVIEQMIVVIPPTESEFKARLVKLSDDSTYQPPESTVYWHKLYTALSWFIGTAPTEEWQWIVCSIMTTKSVEELKEMTKGTKHE